MALDKIKQISGTGVYVPGSDIDTDRIIPARFMKCVTFDGLGEYLFYDVRKAEDGSNKEHPLNDARFANASVLISGANFGCGSSREHAPQAIYRYGFRAVIAESFAEIFFGNSTTLGMPCVCLSGQDIQTLTQLIQKNPETAIHIDLHNKTVQAGTHTFALDMPETAREALTTGRWDPIADLLENANKVSSHAKVLGYVEV